MRIQGELTLTIRDNGRGITKAELSSVESIGLLGMTERARMLGGRVTIAGLSGRGTTVTVTVPVTPGRAGLGHREAKADTGGQEPPTQT